jgi:hypothetical protein
MSSSQAVTAYGRSPAPGLAIVTATAFAIGALLGVAVQGALDRATMATATSTQRIAVVPGNGMSDAAYAAFHRTVAAHVKVVPDNSMSDAAYAAWHPTAAAHVKIVRDSDRNRGGAS